ncbi:MAG: molybdopterin-dependent oxidoreductase [Candidatus Bathyarchaeota archaeon]|nr:molybdopterin-dependent oxidoreductase [Candidatus Bathyarchaeota archaeon]
MDKNMKIIFTAITLIVIVVAAGAVIFYLPGNSGVPAANPALPQGSPPQVELKITGDVAAEKTLGMAELTGMPLISVTATIKDETATYLGVTVTQLLNETGALWDAGKINVIAADGFKRSINTYQAFNSTQYEGNEFILAVAKDGQWMDTSEGPLKLIVPGLESNYNVKSVAEINLQPWILTVNGSVAHSMVLTGTNITNYEVKTVTAAFVPGGEAQRTSDWTGVSVQSLLDAAGVSLGASKITVTAIDGYSREFSLSQVQSTGMMVGTQENGVYLSPDGGAPFRLFVPTEEFKWGQNWVRWVAEITVS